MKNVVANPSDRIWISTGEAQRRLGVNHNQFSRLVRKGVLTTKVLPGLRPLVDASDIERLVIESVRPAVGV